MNRIHWILWAVNGKNGRPQTSVSQCIHKNSKCHRILENEHSKPIISRVYAPTEINGSVKYEQNPLHIVVCRVVKRAGQMDGWTDSTSRNNTLRLNGPRVKMPHLYFIGIMKLSNNSAAIMILRSCGTYTMVISQGIELISIPEIAQLKLCM